MGSGLQAGVLMAMAGRHIRHDWQQFVVWDQKSVRTLCGRTSTWNATGIPGVSEQEEVVEVAGKKVFGWCTVCAVSAFITTEQILGDYTMNLHPYIRPMYIDVAEITQPIHQAWVDRQQRRLRV